MSWIFFTLSSALGAVVASALHSLAMKGAGAWGKTRSTCDHCKKRIKARDLVPVLSWLLLAGKTRCCKKPLSGTHVFIEVLGACAGGWVGLLAYQGAESVQVAMALVVSVIALYTAALDQRRHLVSVIGVSIAMIVLFALQVLQGQWVAAVLGALIGIGVFGGQWVISRGRWIGSGDIWLGALIGVALGPVLGLIAIGLGYVIGALVAVYLLLRGKATPTTRMPLGVYLMLGLLVVSMFSKAIGQFLILP